MFKKAIIAAAAVAGLAGSGVPAASAGTFQSPKYPKYTKDVTIVWWNWLAKPDQTYLIKQFNKLYPNIHIVTPLVGSGSVEYNKLTTVLHAGSGAPDVVMIEQDVLPEFIAMGGLLDITKYVGQYKKYFYPWAWNMVTENGKVYALPEDASPMGMIYLPNVFSKYHLKVPVTWADYAADAAKLHKANPKLYIGSFPTGFDMMAFWWQAGATPFQLTSNGWKINLNSPVIKKVTNYWGTLLKQGYITNSYSMSTAQVGQARGKGMWATQFAEPWWPEYMLRPVETAATKHWELTYLPQWSAKGPKRAANNGGSTIAVTVQSKHPEAAAIFASWLWTSYTGVNWLMKAGLAADKYGVDTPNYNIPSTPPIQTKHPDVIWEQLSAQVPKQWQWSPWSEYVVNQLNVELTKAEKGQETYDQALDNLQNAVVNFARSQGYTVVG